MQKIHFNQFGVIFVLGSLWLGYNTLSTKAWAESDFTEEINIRQKAFSDLNAHLNDIEDEVENVSIHWDKIADFSASSVKLVAILKTNFTEGSHKGSSAKKKIWRNWQHFSTQMDSLNAAITELYLASKDRDVEKVRKELEAAYDTCSACHRKYRSIW